MPSVLLQSASGSSLALPLPSAKPVSPKRRGGAKAKQSKTAKPNMELMEQEGAAITIQRHARGHAHRCFVSEQEQAAMVIQKHIRGHIVRTSTLGQEQAAMVIQRHIRGHQVRTSTEQPDTYVSPREAEKRAEKTEQQRKRKALKDARDESRSIQQAAEWCFGLLESDFVVLMEEMAVTLEAIKEQEVAAHSAFDLERASDALAVADMQRQLAIGVASAQAEAASAATARDQGASTVRDLMGSVSELTSTVSAQAIAIESTRADGEASKQTALATAKARFDGKIALMKKEAATNLEIVTNMAAKTQAQALDNAAVEAANELSRAVAVAEKQATAQANASADENLANRIKSAVEEARQAGARDALVDFEASFAQRLGEASAPLQAKLEEAVESANAWAERAQHLNEDLDVVSEALGCANQRLAKIGPLELTMVRTREVWHGVVRGVRRRRAKLLTSRPSRNGIRQEALDDRQRELEAWQHELDARQQSVDVASPPRVVMVADEPHAPMPIPSPTKPHATSRFGMNRTRVGSRQKQSSESRSSNSGGQSRSRVEPPSPGASDDFEPRVERRRGAVLA